ncbi:hypothetical protein E2I00_013043, partial [Balaenoptera physalus]
VGKEVEKEGSIQAEHHEGALTHQQPPAATVAKPRPWRSIATGTQHYIMLYSPLSSKLLRNVIRVEFQEADGDCHLQAFVYDHGFGPFLSQVSPVLTQRLHPPPEPQPDSVV